MNIEEIELIFQRLEDAIRHYVGSYSFNGSLIEVQEQKKKLELQLGESQIKLMQMQNVIRETVRYLDNMIIDMNKNIKC